MFNLVEDDDYDDVDDDDDSFGNTEEDIQMFTALEAQAVADEAAAALTPIAPPEPLTLRAIQKLAKQKRDFLKKYFSSFSARRSPVTYFGIDDEHRCLVHSNTAGQYFVNRMASELGVHLMYFKKEEDWERIIELRKELFMTNPDKVYQVKLPNYIAQVNKWKLDNVKLWKQDGKVMCAHVKAKEGTLDPKKNVVVVPINNFHLNVSLRRHFQAICTAVESDEFKSRCVWVDLDKDPNLVGITSYASIPVNEFLNSDGVPLFDNHYPILQPILFDGIGTPSTKEFVKKQENCTYRLCAWVEEDKYIRHMTVYEDEHVLVRSMKPNNYLYPLPIHKFNTLKGD